MATGDLKNNLRKLISELKRVNHPQADLDIKGIAQGVPKASLPIVHHIFLEYSYSLAQFFAGKGYDLYGKTDLRFMEAVYKVLRDEFGYKPQLTKDQFLAIGFAERKIIFLCDVLKLMRDKHKALVPKGTEKTENKKAKNSTSGLKTASCESTVRKAAYEKFPGPLPVHTDMRNFKSNQEAEKGGLGLTKPLVVRAMDYDDTIYNERNTVPSTKIGAQKDLTSKGNPRRVASSVEDPVPSNLVVKTSSGDQELCSVKFPVSQNSEVRANLSRQAQPKTVTWKDELLEAQTKQDRVQASQGSDLATGPVNAVFVPTTNHSVPYQVKTNQPTHLVNAISTCPPAHTIPSPVAMTTVPTPSQELLLTPTVKFDHPVPIPLSNSRYEQDSHVVSHAGLVDGRLPSARVVRHSSGPDNRGGGSIVALPSADDQIYLLRQQLGELQDKFDSLVLSNNEMSARVVLLESRFKLLEGASKGNSCSNCYNHSRSTSGKLPSQCVEHRVVAGFEVGSTTREPVDSSPGNSHANSYQNGHCGVRNIHKSPLVQTSASRKLFDEKSPFHFSSESDNSKDLRHATSPVSSNRLTQGSSNELEYHPEPGKSPISLGSPSSIHDVLGSQPTTPDISGVFSESSTKNTVMNVHKRLRETHDLLARTNRDFAAKFSHYQGLQ